MVVSFRDASLRWIGAFAALALVTLSGIDVAAEASKPLKCDEQHRKTMNLCRSHEQSVGAESLSIVGRETRSRVVREARGRLQDLKAKCVSLQKQCALICDEQLETAAADGGDITKYLDLMQDCRQGEVDQHVRLITQKISELNKILRQDERSSDKVTQIISQPDLLQ